MPKIKRHLKSIPYRAEMKIHGQMYHNICDEGGREHLFWTHDAFNIFCPKHTPKK